MTPLLLWLVVCGITAIMTVRRPRFLVIVALVLYVMIPFAAVRAFVGVDTGAPLIHPGGWLALVGLLVQVLVARREVFTVVMRHALVVLAAAITIVLALLFTYVASGFAGMGTIVDEIIAPLALFVLITVELARRPEAGRTTALAVLTLAAVQVAISLAVWARVIAQPFQADLGRYYWYVPGAYTRSLGTTDHPLTLSLMMIIALALLPNIRSSILQSALGVGFLVTVILTESRTGLLLGNLGLLLLLVRRGASRGARLALAVAMTVSGLLFLTSALSPKLARKFVDDHGSADARTQAVQALLSHLGDYAVVGRGSNASFGVARSLGLTTSLENPFLMYTVDFGLIAAVVYFGALFAIVLAPGHRATAGGRLAGLLAFLAVQTYSSVATQTSAGALLWVALALALRTSSRDARAAQDRVGAAAASARSSSRPGARAGR